MPELDELLTEYVDERTPEHAPSFAQVERAVVRQRRRRSLATVAAVSLVAGGIAVATFDQPRAEEDPATPPVSAPVLGVLDDGPPPARFKFGTTVMVLAGEVPIISVVADQDSTDSVVVEVARDTEATCIPHTMVRILAQDTKTVRIAAYRYSVAPDQPDGQQCPKPGGKDVRIPLDLRWQLGNRKVLAGTTGNRSVLN